MVLWQKKDPSRLDPGPLGVEQCSCCLGKISLNGHSRMYCVFGVHARTVNNPNFGLPITNFSNEIFYCAIKETQNSLLEISVEITDLFLDV